MRALAARLMHARAQGTSFGEIDRALGRTRERARQLAAFRACLVTYSPLITINVSSRRARAADEQPRAGDRRGDGPLARLRGVARAEARRPRLHPGARRQPGGHQHAEPRVARARRLPPLRRDRKSTRLNSSHVEISYAVFCLKKKKKKTEFSNLLNQEKK